MLLVRDREISTGWITPEKIIVLNEEEYVKRPFQMWFSRNDGSHNEGFIFSLSKRGLDVGFGYESWLRVDLDIQWCYRWADGDPENPWIKYGGKKPGWSFWPSFYLSVDCRRKGYTVFVGFPTSDW